MRPLWLILAPIPLTAACATAPEIRHPGLPTAVPETWSATEEVEGEIGVDWWTVFGEPGLTAAVEQALQGNLDLKSAAARVDRAVAQARIAGADLKPTVGATLSGSRRRQNFIGLPIPGREGGVLSTTYTNLGVSLAFGVLFSTVISLILVPAGYSIMEDLKAHLAAWRRTPELDSR